MGRFASFEVKRDTKARRWYVSVPARLSPTGKRQRKYFAVKQDAATYGKKLSSLEQRNAMLVKKLTPEVAEAATYYHELFQIYGYSGLKEACQRLEKDLIAESQSYSFGNLFDAFEKEHFNHWSVRHQESWRSIRNLFEPHRKELLVRLNVSYWREWFADVAAKKNWSARTYNFHVGRISTIYSWGVKNEFCEDNPAVGISRRKIKKMPVSILMPDQVRLLLETTWEYDRDMIPYFAIGMFAGLRPSSELEVLQWEDVNFEEKWIRVQFGNKTDTKRFVPIEDNLAAWLAPWKHATGAVCPVGFVKRRRVIVRGKYLSPAGTPASEWKPVASWSKRDVMRHSYGSYLDAKYRDRNMVKENMGHTDFKTYDQHYRRALTPKQGEEFWSIMPPSEPKTC